MKLPYMQFFPGDWLTDPSLRRCSLAARGLWIDLISLMWKCPDRGVLESGGSAWSDEEISAVVGAPLSDTASAIAELLRLGVAYRNKSGALCSRRLVRDEHIRQQRALAGSKGGLAKALKGSKTPSKSASKTLAPSEDEDDSEDVRKKKERQRWESATRAMSGCALKTDKFRAAWNEWTEYRKGLRKQLTVATIKKQIGFLENLGHDGAIAAIDYTIFKGWTGLVDPEDTKAPRRAGTDSKRREREAREQQQREREDRKVDAEKKLAAKILADHTAEEIAAAFERFLRGQRPAIAKRYRAGGPESCACTLAEILEPGRLAELSRQT